MNENGYTIVLDEPWVFLDIRNNPVNGRKITFELEDGTIMDVDVSLSEYHNPNAVKAKIEKMIVSHNALFAK